MELFTSHHRQREIRQPAEEGVVVVHSVSAPLLLIRPGQTRERRRTFVPSDRGGQVDREVTLKSIPILQQIYDYESEKIGIVPARLHLINLIRAEEEKFF